MLDELGRVAQLIEDDLADVERMEPRPPIHASLKERRTKLQETIDTLEARLAHLRNG